MSEDYVKRAEYHQGQSRIHERVDKIDKSISRQEAIVERIEKAVDKMHQVMFGNGRDGFIQKITKAFERISLHTKIICFLCGSIGLIAFCIIQGFLNKGH